MALPPEESPCCTHCTHFSKTNRSPFDETSPRIIYLFPDTFPRAEKCVHCVHPHPPCLPPGAPLVERPHPRRNMTAPSLTVVGFLEPALKADMSQAGLRPARQVSLLDFQTQPVQDELVVCYALASGDALPRLSKGTSLPIEAGGDRVVANYLFADVDRQPHDLWPADEDVEATIQAALEAAYDEAMGAMDRPALAVLSSAAWYATPRGYRLMWRLASPLGIRRYESLFLEMSRALARVGVLVDGNTCDWTRLSHLPCGNGRTPAAVDWSGLDTPLDVAKVFPGLTETPDQPVKRATAGDIETLAPHPPTWEHWAFLPSWLRQGPFPGDDSGERFKAMRGALASVARILPDAELDDDVVLRAMVGAWKTTEEQGGAGSWGWEDIEGLAGHVLDGETKQRKALMNIRDWFIPKRDASAPADPSAPPAQLVIPEEPTAPDWEQLRSIASNQKLRGYVDRLVERRLPTTDTQAAARRDLLRQLCERAFSQRGFYSRMSAQAIAESLYRVFGFHLEATGMHTCDELVDFLQRVGQEAAEMRRRDARREEALAAMREDLPPLLVRGDTGSFYVLDSRRDSSEWTYVPAAASVLGQVLRTYAYPGIPEELHIAVSGNRAGLRSSSELVDEFGAPVIQQVVYDYDVTRARLEGDTLVLPTLTRPSIEARYHPAVDAWLAALAGDAYDTLVLWLVAAQNLNLPLQCLYLTGPPGAGKSLLQKGLARIWNGQYCDFNTFLLDDFQEHMLKTPLLVADDGITIDPRSAGRISNVFRQTLTEDSRSVNIKYQPKCQLRGHYRLIVSANGDTGIPFTAALGRDALMALAERIFHVPAGDLARSVLEAYRGTPEGEDFVTPTGGKVAEHLLYLAQTVVLPPIQKRFAVEIPGYAAWADEWSAEQGILPETRTAVAHVVRCMREGRTVDGCYRLSDDPEHVLVQLSAVRTGWKAVSSHRGQPNNREMRQALEDLAGRAAGVDYSRQRYGALRSTDAHERLRGYVFPLSYRDVDSA